MTKPLNPICGRPGCKYKVAHEHVHFPVQGHSITPVVQDSPLLDEEAIAKALRAQPAQDDPSADRFRHKTPEDMRHEVVLDYLGTLTNQVAQLNAQPAVPQWASIMTTNFEKLYSETELLKRETESGLNQLFGSLARLFTNANRIEANLLTAKSIPFSKLVFACMAANVLLIALPVGLAMLVIRMVPVVEYIVNLWS